MCSSRLGLHINGLRIASIRCLNFNLLTPDGTVFSIFLLSQIKISHPAVQSVLTISIITGKHTLLNNKAVKKYTRCKQHHNNSRTMQKKHVNQVMSSTLKKKKKKFKWLVFNKATHTLVEIERRKPTDKIKEYYPVTTCLLSTITLGPIGKLLT